MRKFLAGVAALAVIATPTLAVAAPSNPAAALSLGNVRAGSPTTKSSKAFGSFGAIGLILLAGIIAIPVIAAVKDDDSDSN